MSENVYSANPNLPRLMGALFLSGVFLSAFFYEGVWAYVLTVMFILVSILCFIVPIPKIVIGPTGIKRLQRNSFSINSLLRISRPDIERKWDEIKSINSHRLSNGNYCTYVESFAENDVRIVFDTNIFLVSDYQEILKELEEKAPNDIFDQTSMKIINGDVGIKAPRISFFVIYTILLVTVISAMVLNYLLRG